MSTPEGWGDNSVPLTKPPRQPKSSQAHISCPAFQPAVPGGTGGSLIRAAPLPGRRAAAGLPDQRAGQPASPRSPFYF